MYVTEKDTTTSTIDQHTGEHPGSRTIITAESSDHPGISKLEDTIHENRFGASNEGIAYVDVRPREIWSWRGKP